MVNKFLFSLLVVAILTSCSNNKSESKDAGSNPETPAEIVNEESKTSMTSINDMAQFEGKLPNEVQLFEKYNLYPRFEKLLGADFADFKADWNEESPIKKDGEIIYMTGCRKGACKDNLYFLTIDLIENNINIINLRNNRPKSYEEGAIIGMPSKLADDFDKVRRSQGL